METCYLVEYMGGSTASVHGLPGTGDLYVTSQAGRNGRMGKLLGKGLRYTHAKTRYMQEETIEGADLALTIGPAIEALLQQKQLDPKALPLTMAIIQAICHDAPLQIPWEEFYAAYNNIYSR
jgi:glycerol-3-phosphate dehydrogenase (NAD(P)+)